MKELAWLFCLRLFHANIMFLRFIHVGTCVSVVCSFELILLWAIPVCPSLDWGSPGMLSNVSYVSFMNILVQAFCGQIFSVPLGKYLVIEVLGHRVGIFLTLLINCQVVFKSSCIILYFCQQCMSYSCSTFSQYLMLQVF